MKLNPVNFIIALALSAVMAFGLWSLDGELKNYVAAGAFFFFAGTLIPGIGVSYELARKTTNLRVLCLAFFVSGFVCNLVFSIFSLSSTAYIIASAVLFLVYVFLANAIYSAKQ